MMDTAADSPRSYPFHHGRELAISYPVEGAGVTVRVMEAGQGERWFVALHGSGSRADRWLPTTPGLIAAGFHVLLIDFPGHGLAEKPRDFEYSAARMAQVVAGVLDALEIRDVVLAGTSLGGHVAATVAVDRPDLVAELVLVGAVGVSEYPERFHTEPEMLADASEGAVRKKLRFLVADDALVTDQWVREESRMNSSPGARDALLQVAEFLATGCNSSRQDTNLRESRPDLPILIVWGEQDRWTPLSMGEEAQRNLRQARLEVMSGCGHAPYFEDPDRFVSLLEKHKIGARSAHVAS